MSRTALLFLEKLGMVLNTKGGFAMKLGKKLIGLLLVMLLLAACNTATVEKTEPATEAGTEAAEVPVTEAGDQIVSVTTKGRNEDLKMEVGF